jgi:hypothetical protein
MLAATDGMGEATLVRLAAARGATVVPALEPSEVFSKRSLDVWRESFPYEYGASTELNVFYTSTQGIGVSALPRRAVVVASTDLQAFPVNLINIDESLAGWTYRLAAAPSLTWLCASRRNPRPSNRRLVAWIPSETPEEGLPSLAPLAEDLSDTFSQHGIRVYTTGDLPAEIGGADLAVVAAHGGVGSDARYFRVVQDDAGAAIGASAFADRLAGTGVAVLFVCSSGRADQHPRANAVVGLVRQLLDVGCRTVIAPPWPLSVVVPRVWLPAFMERWSVGVPAIDACFEANVEVRRRRGDSPGEALAMTVYGEPLSRIANTE